MNPTYIEESDAFLRNNLDHFNILLVTATPLEKEELHKCLLPIDRKSGIITIAYKQQTYFLARYGKYNVVHVSCGDMGAVGRESAIVTTVDAIGACKPKVVMMIGIAFGTNKSKQKIGDILITERIIPYEPQRIGAEIQDRGKAGPAGKGLLNMVRNAMNWHLEINGRPVVLEIGDIVSGEKLVDDEAFRNSLIKRYPSAKGGDMEGAAIYAACDGKVNEWIMIKGICDFADGKKKHQKKRKQLLAVGTVLNFCQYLFQKEFAFEAMEVDTAANQRKKSKNGRLINGGKRAVKNSFSARLSDKRKIETEIVKKGKTNFSPKATLDKRTQESNNINNIFLSFLNILEQLLRQNKNVSLQLKSEFIKKGLKNSSLLNQRQIVFCDMFKRLANEFTLVKSLFEQQIISDNHSVAQMIAGSIFEMVDIDTRVLPKYLTEQLNIADSNQEYLTKFLYNFRKSIAVQSDFIEIISFVNELLQADLIKGLSHRIASELDLQHRINANIAFETKQRNLSKKAADALEKYLIYLRTYQLKYSVLPLSKTSAQTIRQIPIKIILLCSL